MSISRFVTSINKLCSSPSVYVQPHYTSQILLSTWKLQNHQRVFWHEQCLGYRYLSNYRNVQKNQEKGRNLFVLNSVRGAPLHSRPPSSNSLRNWILGIMVTIVLPFLTNQWGPLFKFKNEVDTTIETIEHITEVVEKVAEEVDKVAEDTAKHLPKDGKFRTAVNIIENVAEQTAKDARLVEDIIAKVQDIEEDVESLVESATGEANKQSRKVKNR